MKTSRIGFGVNSLLVVEGPLTIEFSREIEFIVTEFIHSPAGLKVDLSGVEEIDLYGISRLVSVLQRRMQDKSLEIVATSPSIEQAFASLSFFSQPDRLVATNHTINAPLSPSVSCSPRSVGTWALFSCPDAKDAHR